MLLLKYLMLIVGAGVSLTAAAIVAYLTLKRDESQYERQRIDEALKNYWHDRAG